MTSTNWVIGIIVAAIIGFGAYSFSRGDDDAMMQGEQGTAMQQAPAPGTPYMASSTDTMAKDNDADAMMQADASADAMVR